MQNSALSNSWKKWGRILQICVLFEFSTSTLYKKWSFSFNIVKILELLYSRLKMSFDTKIGTEWGLFICLNLSFHHRITRLSSQYKLRLFPFKFICNFAVKGHLGTTVTQCSYKKKIKAWQSQIVSNYNIYCIPTVFLLFRWTLILQLLPLVGISTIVNTKRQSMIKDLVPM